MTSTRRTIPAPPPNGVSSTWPHFSGVEERTSTVSTEWPSASAFSTCRWVRNQSNHCGNSVKTSAFTEESEVDVDAPGDDIDRADAVADERHEQFAPVRAVDLQDLHGRQRAHPADEPHVGGAVDDRAPFEVGGPVLVVGEHRVVARDHEFET